MVPKYQVFLAVVIVLLEVLEISKGDQTGRNSRHLVAHRDEISKVGNTNHEPNNIFDLLKKKFQKENTGHDALRVRNKVRKVNKHHIGKEDHILAADNYHHVSDAQKPLLRKDKHHIFRKVKQGHNQEVDLGLRHKHQHRSNPVRRVRRQTLSKRPRGKGFSSALNLPKGITYTWTRDYSTGKSFDEAAFKSKNQNVVVVLSFDDALKDANLTASATLYDFTGTSGIMAIKTRKRPGPCFLLETSLTYDKIIGELESRNGSSVSTNTIISLDGTGSPVSPSERQFILKKTPSFARQCRGREIIRARPTEYSPPSIDGQNKELKILTMDAEVSITVPVDPEPDFATTNQWSQTNFKSRWSAKGRDIWKTT